MDIIREELNHWTGLVDWTSGLIEIVRKPLLGMNFDSVGYFGVLTGLDLHKTVRPMLLCSAIVPSI